MENKRSESDEDYGEFSTSSDDYRSIRRAIIIPIAECIPGSVIQPVNPHYSGVDVVADVGNEDTLVEGMQTPCQIAVMLANEEATPLSQDEVAAIHVAPEFIASSDDERPASSYPLLDRRRYRVDPPPVVDLTGPMPLAIGRSLVFDEELQDFNSFPLRRSTSSSTVAQNPPNIMLNNGGDEAESSNPARKRRRKRSRKERVTEDTPQRPARKDDDDEE
jgi:hypothetical protein